MERGRRMTNTEIGEGDVARKTIMDRLIPPKYDFYCMLTKQAAATAAGIACLVRWLEAPSADNYQELMKHVDEADAIRLNMEDCLVKSFSTPFDRQDMYVFSVRLDRILELAKSTALAVEAYEVTPDPHFTAMAADLSVGVANLARATALLEKNPAEAEQWIEQMRGSIVAVGSHYRAALARLFASADTMTALKYREVFNELKDAAEWMELTLDVFHKIIVRLA